MFYAFMFCCQSPEYLHFSKECKELMLSHQKKAAAAKYLQDGEDILYCAGVHTHVSMVLQLLHKRNGLVEQGGKTTFTLLSLMILL